MIRELVALCAVGTVGLALAGCHKNEAPVDPYTTATLREAVYGEVVSPDFKYKLVNPQIIDGLGEFVVIQQSKQTEFLVANGLAAKIDSLPDKAALTFNVVKQFQPMVHFLCVDIITPTVWLPGLRIFPMACRTLIERAVGSRRRIESSP